MKNIYGYSLESLTNEMLNLSEKKFRGKQLFKWIYEKKVSSFDEMSDVSLVTRELLKTLYSFYLPTVFKKEISADGTIKLLLEMEDGSKVETVLMPYDYGDACCVSSQVGCNMGCKFCASGLLKKKRNLETFEMVGQVLVVNQILEELSPTRHVTHVVIMGTGEPFDNYDNVIEFLKVINEQIGLAIGARHITVSTCGIVPKIKEFGKLGLQVNLAISLHASNDELRNELMPINSAYPLKELIDAIKEYSLDTGRRVTYEYILLAGVNDDLKYADELATLIRPTYSYVNLIPYNEVSENGFKRGSGNQAHRFMDRLMHNGVKATIRKEFGSDIDAACGQLRAKFEK